MSESDTENNLPKPLKSIPKAAHIYYYELAQYLEDKGELNNIDRIALSNLAQSMMITKRIASKVNKANMEFIMETVGKNDHKQQSVYYQVLTKEREFQMKTLKEMQIGSYSKMVLKKKMDTAEGESSSDPQDSDKPKSAASLRKLGPTG